MRGMFAAWNSRQTYASLVLLIGLVPLLYSAYLGRSDILWFFCLLMASLGLCDLAIHMGKRNPFFLPLLLLVLLASLIWLVVTLQPVNPPGWQSPLPTQYLMIFIVLTFLLIVTWCTIFMIIPNGPTRRQIYFAAVLAYVIVFLALSCYKVSYSFNYAMRLAWLTFSTIPIALIWEAGYTPRRDDGVNFWGRRSRLASTIVSVACTFLIPMSTVLPFLILWQNIST